MTSEWYEYVLKFDNMLAEALLICARNSLNNVYNALRSEGDVNPSPIIIVLVDVEGQNLSFKPDMETIKLVLVDMYERIYKSLCSVPRIAKKLELPTKLAGRPFSELMKADKICNETQDSICLEIEYNIAELELFSKGWNFFNEIWLTTEDEFITNITETDQTGFVFESSIESLTAKAEVIGSKESIENVYFLMIDQTLLKNTLMDFIEKWQLLNIKLLTKRASSRIKSKLSYFANFGETILMFYVNAGVYRYIKRNEKRIAVVPRTLKEAREATLLFNRLSEEVGVKQEEFPDIYELFRVLDKYQIDVSSSIKTLIDNLETTWENYLRKLSEAHNMLDNTKEDFKQNLLTQAEKFRNTMKEFLADFMAKLPTSSQT